MQRTLSIIVVALNEVRQLPRLKAAIDRLTKPADLLVETILVDGGSDDGTPDVARQAGFTKVIVMQGASIPACRNRGLREAGGEWIAFLDGDCEPAMDWITNASPHLVTAEPVIMGWPVEPPVPGTWVQRAWHAHWQHKNRASVGGEVVTHEAFRLITTRNVFLTRAAAEQLGGFDEALVTGEDTDFVFRGYTRRFRVLGVPSLQVIHHGEPATLGQFFKQQLWHANKTSYSKIMDAQGTNAGRNAVIFSWTYAACLALFVLAIPTTILFSRAAIILFLPLVALLLGPALIIAFRAGKLTLIPALAALYAAYGLARTLDLIGLAKDKTSWKLR